MSDSDEEDEYTEGKKVFDSDSEAEEEEEINEDALPTDKKRVLDFFNEATEPELVAIQGMKIFFKNGLYYTDFSLSVQHILSPINPKYNDLFCPELTKI